MLELHDIFIARFFVFHLYPTFNVHEFFYKFSFLRHFFQFETLKTKNPLEWGLNKRFETNMEVKVNLFTDISKLSSLYNYKSVSQIMFELSLVRLLFTWSYIFSRFSARLNRSPVPRVCRTTGLKRLEDSCFLHMFFLSFNTETGISLLASWMSGAIKKPSNNYRLWN